MWMWNWLRDRFITLEGRIDRVTLARRYGALYLIIFVPAVAGVFTVLETATHDTYALMISALAGLLFIAVGIPLLVRRFHDFDVSAHFVVAYYGIGFAIGAARALAMHREMDGIWRTLAQGETSTWMLLWYVPGLAWALLPFVLPGTPGPNRFGPAPSRAALLEPEKVHTLATPMTQNVT
jgi:uncharacterized membrane protein YhaH (DUF805 family)